MSMSSAHDGDPSFRQRHVHETLEDHESRITRNERWRLLLKGAIVGLAMASGSDQAIGAIVNLL